MIPDKAPTGNLLNQAVAWVCENNPKDYVLERFNPDKQPRGDRDCKLGCKRKRNRSVAEGNGGEAAPAAASGTAAAKPASAPPAVVVSSTSTTPASNPKPGSKVEIGEYYWGYASGVVATKVEAWGEFVLAEFTQTFDKGDASASATNWIAGATPTS